MTVAISPTRAAPGDSIEAVLAGAPFSLLQIQVRYLIIALQDLASGSAVSWISPGATVIDATTLRFIVPGAPGSGGMAMTAGWKRVVFRFGMWQDRAQDLEVVAVPGLATAPPATAPPPPMPVSAGVHLMQISPDVAGPGQSVLATLLDGSLDFSRVSPAAFSVWLTVIGTGAAVNYRVMQYRVVDARTIQLTVPPIGPGGFRAGGYRVVMRYGFWEGRGQRDLRVTATAVATRPSAPAGPRGMVLRPRPALGIALPPSSLGAGWPAPLASALPGRTANPRVAPVAGYRLPGAFNHLLGPGLRLAPVIAMPAAAMPIFLAAAPPAPAMRAPVPAALPAGTTLATLPAVCRSRVRDRIDAFFSLTATAASAAESVQPLVDGLDITTEIAALIAAAERYLYIAVWALDAVMRLGAAGQQHAGGDLPADSIAYLVRRRAAERMLMSRPLDVKLLVWRSPLDDEYAASATDLEEMTSCFVTWSDIAALDPSAPAGASGLLRVLRGAPYFSSAPDALLLEVFRAYRHRPVIAPATRVRFPSGIAVATQKHGAALTGSHHQKMVISELGAYIGGLNLVKDYWDSSEHLVRDPRRASSNGPASGGAGGSFSSVGASGLLHDTGAIVRGPSIEQALEVFAMRWDAAVEDGACHERLAERFAHDLLPAIAARFTDPAELAAQAIRQSRVIDGTGRFAGAPEPAHGVEDVLVVASLPSGTGYGPVEDVKASYLRAIQSLTDPTSFALFETQYFSDRGLAKHLYRQWHNHRGTARPAPRPGQPPEEREQRPYPFAYFVIPYNPSTAWADEVLEPVPFVDSERLEGLWGEFQNLRWLEIQTARIVFTQTSPDAPWVPTYEITSPARQVVWTDGGLAHAPDGLDLDSEVTFKDAYVLDASGARLPGPITETRWFEARQVMTYSDIMGFCVVGEGSTLARRSGRDHVRDYLLAQEIYVHSKAALFLNEDGSPSYATIGSANLNPRSLGDGGDQDSELNVWLAGRERVDALWKQLAREHTGASDPTPHGFAGQGWENLRRLLAGDVVTGRVVRLDVADRWVFQSTRPT